MAIANLAAQLPGWQMIIFFSLVGLFFVVGGITAFVILYQLRWNFLVTIVEAPTGKSSEIVGRDRARKVRIGNGGEELYELRKRKVLKIGFGKRLGKNQIGFAIGEDGFWYNFTFGNFNKVLLEQGIMPIAQEMRFAHTLTRDIMDAQYKAKKDFMERWGTTIAISLIIVALVIVGIGNYITHKQNVQAASINLETVKLSKELAETNLAITSNLDNLKNGGSGLRPA